MKKLLLVLFLAVNGYSVTVSDNFTGTANPIGGNWSTANGANAIQKINNRATPSGLYGSVYWNANTFNDNQFAKATYVSGNYCQALARVQSSYNLSLIHI